MKLMLPTTWRKKYFDADSHPSDITLSRWLREGKIPARKVGGSWYVDEHAWLANSDPLVQRVLDAG